MKVTLKSLIIVGVITAAISATANVPETDLLFTMRGFMPEKNGDWNRAAGIEMQARFWNGGNVGAAVSAGIDSWVANSEYLEEEDEFSYYSSSIYGTTTIMPLGISALLRGELNDRTAFVVEAGFRYGLTDSRISAETAYADAEDTFYTVETVQSDNVMLGVVGLTMQTALVDGLWLHGGFRYQFDLVEAHEYYLGEDLGTTSFKTASVDLGLAWSF